MDRLAYTVAEATERLALASTSSVYALIRSGEIRAYRISGKSGEFRVPHSELIAYQERQMRVYQQEREFVAESVATTRRSSRAKVRTHAITEGNRRNA